MRRTKQILKGVTLAVVMCGLLSVGLSGFVKADTMGAPSLVIGQLKITSSNGQLIMLYNTTDNTLDMSRYQLEYFNSYDLAKATSSRLIALSGSLPPHSYYIINDSTVALCYSAIVNSMSLGFSSTAGFIEVLGLDQLMPGGLVTPALQDYVGWSKTAATGAQTLPTNTSTSLLRQPFDSQNNPSVTAPGAGTWLSVKPDPANACNYVTSVTIPTQVTTGMNQLLPSSEPPFTIVEDVESSAGDSIQTASLPAADNGLMKPVISELLPNPNGTGNDATDEFIELYNPNPTIFDLSGFTLTSGTTTTHTYVFPAGTTLPALSFAAFYSATTKLSLSNTVGGAALLDPLGNTISETDPYSSAKDGQSWILANGLWNWTITPTPGMANILHQPAQKAIAKKTAAKSSGKTAASSSSKNASKSSKVLGTNTSTSYTEPKETTPIHMWTLALVGSLALLYAGYEYRADLANKIFQFRRNLGAWRKPRP